MYSAHDYGPNLYQQSWFNGSTTYQSLVGVWTRFWAYLSLNNVAPVWVGEFGTTNNASDIESNVAGSQGQWFQSIVTFLQNNPQIDWTYWALNGEDSYALLDSNYDSTPVSSLKQQLLASIQSPGGGGGSCQSASGGSGGLDRDGCFFQPDQPDVDCGDAAAELHSDVQRVFEPVGEFPSLLRPLV